MCKTLLIYAIEIVKNLLIDYHKVALIDNFAKLFYYVINTKFF